jgi:transposase
MQRSTAMKHYAGLDVSIKETSVCIVDESGKLCRERKVASHPEDLVAILSDPAFSLERVGVEAGPLSQWVFEGLARVKLARARQSPTICSAMCSTRAGVPPHDADRPERRDDIATSCMKSGGKSRQ